MYDDQQYKTDQALYLLHSTYADQKTTAADQTVAAAVHESKIKFFKAIKLNALRANIDSAITSGAQAKGDHTYTIKLTDGATNYGQVAVSTGTAADLITGTIKSASIPKDTVLQPKLVITADAGGTKGTHSGMSCHVLTEYQERWA